MPLEKPLPGLSVHLSCEKTKAGRQYRKIPFQCGASCLVKSHLPTRTAVRGPPPSWEDRVELILRPPLQLDHCTSSHKGREWICLPPGMGKEKKGRVAEKLWLKMSYVPRTRLCCQTVTGKLANGVSFLGVGSDFSFFLLIYSKKLRVKILEASLAKSGSHKEPLNLNLI